ncbi:MAG: HepT-like ribonuclease domain-containing protein [Bryobacteraceae bacterium]
MYTAEIESTWPAVPVVYDAVCRNLEIIGEAASKLDDAFRAAHSDIPWRAMTDARNILIHAYYQVAPEILADIARADIPELLASVDLILGNTQE